MRAIDIRHGFGHHRWEDGCLLGRLGTGRGRHPRDAERPAPMTVMSGSPGTPARLPAQAGLRKGSVVDTYDIVVIGSGNNGLTVANYLAKAGLSVMVLERRLEEGGGLSTEHIFPGYYSNFHRCSTSSLGAARIPGLRARTGYVGAPSFRQQFIFLPGIPPERGRRC